MNNNGRLFAIAIAIILAMVFRDWVKAGVQHLTLQARSAAAELRVTPTPEATPTPPVPGPASEPASNPPSGQSLGNARYERCLDGSALTVTDRDGKQTNYRCGSGAVGAYTN